MNNTGDIYESGTPKYATAQDIYDALCEMAQTQEMAILGEMFEDISYEGQTYYYTEKGNALKEKIDALTDDGYKLWVMDLAIWQLDEKEANELVYEALANDDLAKRIGFKKIFIEHLLGGDKAMCDEMAEAYLCELGELDCYDYYSMVAALNNVMPSDENQNETPYRRFAWALSDKASAVRLEKEKQVIIECRAMLSSYDDFLFGLRSNAHLYKSLEQSYQNKMMLLEENFKKTVAAVISAAQAQGVELHLGNGNPIMIEGMEE